MKFNKTLQNSVQHEWKAYAVPYKKCKKTLGGVQLNNNPTNDNNNTTTSNNTKETNSQFWKLYHQSLEDISRFNSIKEKQIQNRLKDAEMQLERHRMKTVLNIPTESTQYTTTANPNENRPVVSDSTILTTAAVDLTLSLSEVQNDLIEMTLELEALVEFYELNSIGYSKILKKYDKRTMSNVRQSEMTKLLETSCVFLNGNAFRKHLEKVSELQFLVDKLVDMTGGRSSSTKAGGKVSPSRSGRTRKGSRNTKDDRVNHDLVLQAQAIVAEIETDSPFFSNNEKRNNPSFRLHEIERGFILGEGEFGTVREIRKFKHVKEICPICFLHDAGTHHTHDRSSPQPEEEEEENEDQSSSSSSSLEEDMTKIVDFTPPTGTDTFDRHDSNDDDEDGAESFQTDHQEEEEEDVAKRGFMAHHCLRDGSARYAIKRVKHALTGNARIEAGIDLAIEANILSVIAHPNIMRLRGTGGTLGHPDFFIVMDRLYGTLGDKFKKWKKEHERFKGFMGIKKDSANMSMLWNERLLAGYDIARGIKYLHGHDLIYRDLKPENIGFDVRGNVKIFDFGLAKELKAKDKVKTDQYKLSGRTGTRRYMAPEVTLCKPYGKPADVYSFAILFWEIMALELPFKQYTAHEKFAKNVVQEKKRPSIPSSFPTIMKGLWKDAWAHDPSARPDFVRVCDLIFGEVCDSSGDGSSETGRNGSGRSKRLLDSSASSARFDLTRR